MATSSVRTLRLAPSAELWSFAVIGALCTAPPWTRLPSARRVAVLGGARDWARTHDGAADGRKGVRTL